MFDRFFDKKSASLTDKSVLRSGVDNNNNNNNNNQIKQNRRPLDLAVLQLAKELHKAIIRKF